MEPMGSNWRVTAWVLSTTKKTAPDGANIRDGGPEGQQSSTPSV